MLGFLFLDPAASESNANGTPVDAPQSWHISFFDARTTPATEAGSGDSAGLDLAFKGAPFVDFKDNAWYVLASAEVQTAGGYASSRSNTLATSKWWSMARCGARAAQRQAADDGGEVHARAGPVRVLVQCHDGDGEFTLKYVG